MISISFTYTFQFFHCRSKKKCLSRKSSLHCTTRALQNTYIKKFVVLILFFFKFRQKCLVFYVHIITMNKSISS